MAHLKTLLNFAVHLDH